MAVLGMANPGRCAIACVALWIQFEAGPFEEIELIIRDDTGQVVEGATGEDESKTLTRRAGDAMQMYMI